jgi:predicted XRE-type DNA-binding protein
MTTETYVSVWDALSDTPEEAANLKARSALLYEIRKAVQKWDLPQEEAAKRLGLSCPRANDLLLGKLAKFSLDALVNIAAAAQLDIEIRVRDAA